MPLALQEHVDAPITKPRVLGIDSARMAATTGASLDARRDSYPSVDRATDSSAHARRDDSPRSCAYTTCCRRTCALTIFFD